MYVRMCCLSMCAHAHTCPFGVFSFLVKVILVCRYVQFVSMYNVPMAFLDLSVGQGVQIIAIFQPIYMSFFSLENLSTCPIILTTLIWRCESCNVVPFSCYINYTSRYMFNVKFCEACRIYVCACTYIWTFNILAYMTLWSFK